ncbi:protein S40-2-like [Cicer arietinum]|uniref:Uncharacterized protein LOC101496240 n=1 Tax=Cicer arietinum TaxID=3827 RepID=A0A1S2XA03_CICAR|nr:uncharacterized protein LOC101496240 [Cicer arietinum]
MAEEFSESEVVFSDSLNPPPPCVTESKELLKASRGENEKKKKKNSVGGVEMKTVTRSMPVSIPDGMFQRWGIGFEEAEDEEEMVPPHVIMARRIAGKMTFSMCTGNGRTLKGRDLSRVRNSILRLTGFIEV